MIQRIMELISQQRSFNAVDLLTSLGLLEVNDIKMVVDYANSNRQRCTMITLGNAVFLCTQLLPLLGGEFVVIGSTKMEKFISVKRYFHGECILTEAVSQAEFGIIDLSTSGKRWEGMIYNNMPCGYGIIYSENNTLEYKGYCYGESKMGFGIDYYEDGDSIPAYEGMFCFGQRHGIGTLFTRQGKPTGEIGYLYGKSYKDQIISVPQNTQDQLFHNTLMYIYIVGNNCYQNADSFQLSGYPFLKSVTIADDCYCNRARKEKTFSIRNCPNLQTIKIGNRSFMHFDHCSIQNLPMLTQLSIGVLQKDCQSFRYCKTLHIKNLPKLKRIVMGDKCFSQQQDTRFESKSEIRFSVDLNSLEYLLIGNECLCGDEMNTKMVIHTDNHFTMKSILKSDFFKDLPSLISFVGNIGNLQEYQHVHIENVPELHKEMIQFGTPIFEFSKRILIDSPGFHFHVFLNKQITRPFLHSLTQRQYLQEVTHLVW